MSIASRAVYPTQPAPLRQVLDDLFESAEPPSLTGEPVGLIVPDSNLLSGAKAAAEAFLTARGSGIDTVVLVSPSHEGEFDRLSVCTAHRYRTPLGDVSVDDALRHELCDEDDDIFLGDEGHYHTEGADVQLPYLQRLFGDDLQVLPVVMGKETPALCKELGRAAGEVLYGKKGLIVGTADVLRGRSSDIEHMRAFLETMDVDGLLALLHNDDFEIEGLGAVIVTVIAAARRGATTGKVLALEPSLNGTPGAIACAFFRE